MAGEIARIVERLRGAAAFDDGGEIEDGEGDHGEEMGAGRAGCQPFLSSLSPQAMGRGPHEVRWKGLPSPNSPSTMLRMMTSFSSPRDPKPCAGHMAT